MFKHSESLSETIGRIFQQTPLSRVVEEKWENGIYTQKQMWDLLISDFSFSPVAYRITQTSSKVDLDKWLLKHKPDWSEFQDPPLASALLIPPTYGRKCTITADGKEIGNITELISATPNRDLSISLFDYVNHSVVSDVGEMIKHIKSALDQDPSSTLPYLLPKLPKEAIEVILAEIDGVDHFGCIAPPEVQKVILGSLVDENGFSITHNLFQSTVLAKELDAPTKVLKAWGWNKRHKKIGLEFFVPTKAPTNVDDWIQRGQGAHIAYLVKDEHSIDLIINILDRYGVPIPAFMQGGIMKNNQEKTSVLYCETTVGNHHFRLEFCHHK